MTAFGVGLFTGCWNTFLLVALFALIGQFTTCEALGEVIWAVNCGGGAHVDINGIHYQKDTLAVGFASDHGKNLGIRRIAMQDQILYQTERYHTGSFSYTLPIKVDGDYVIVMKFSEVWFNEPNQKVFNVMLNDKHIVVNNLDLFAVAGLGVAHDEIVPFSIKKGNLLVHDESSEFDGTLKIGFIKLDRDNPKVNAIYIIRGHVDDVPQLPPLERMDHFTPHDDEEEEDEDGQKSRSSERRRRTITETRIPDPYASEDASSMLIPVFVAIGAFIPLVFCLCKL